MDTQNRIGAYRIIRLVNRGGQGTVYLGYDTLLKRRVAIKIYDLPTQRSERKRLVAEAQLVASLDSPKIVPVHDVIESDAHLAMVMAYVPGCSLEEFLAGFRPSLGSIVTVGTDIAGALAIARQEQIVHGDVKPANVLLSLDGHARLTDFGIARDTRRSGFTGPGAGSFWSVTPEHLREEEVTQQADIFALGVLLYRMLCLQHPFAVNGQLDVDRMLHHAPYPLAERVPPEFEMPPILDDLIGTMLHKDPRQRPGNTRGIRQVLRDVSRDIPMSVGSTLLRESRAFFRPESPQDIPLEIPRELMRSGRSRKTAPQGVAQQIAYWFTGLRRPYQAGLLCGAVLCAIVLARHILNFQVTPVAFAEPVTEVASGTVLPRGLSRDWLVERVRDAVAEQLGNIEVLGSVGAFPATTFYSAAAAPPVAAKADETFAISLRCDDAFCLAVISRKTALGLSSEHVALFPDMPLAQWEAAIQKATRAVFQ